MTAGRGAGSQVTGPPQVMGLRYPSATNQNTACPQGRAATHTAERSRRASLRAHVDNLLENTKEAGAESTALHDMALIQGTGSMIGIPTLTKENYAVWLYAVKAFAQENDILEHVTGDVDIPAAGDARRVALKRRAQAGRVIISTLSQDMILELGDGITDHTPYEMLNKIKAELEGASTPEEHERLLRKAQTTRINRGETIEKYLKRHREIRQQMLRAGYPNIREETTTVAFAVQGLMARPGLAQHAPMLLMQRIETLRKLEAAIDLLGTIEKPRHRPARYEQGRWDVPMRVQPERPPAWQHNEATTRSRGRPLGGRGRGGARRNYYPRQHAPYQSTANATVQQDPIVSADEWAAEDISSAPKPQGDDTVNSDYTDLYYIDSACTPTFTRRPPPQGTKRDLSVLLPNGRSTTVQHVSNARLRLQNGARLMIGELAHATQFTRNLMSVPQITKANNCTVVLGPRGGAIIAGELDIKRAEVIGQIDRCADLYTIRAEVSHGGPMVSYVQKDHAKPVSIRQYFRQRKQSQPHKPLEQRKPPPLLYRQTPAPENTTQHKKPVKPTARNKNGRFANHLPGIPQRAKALVDSAHTWHLRLNHTAPETVRIMTSMATTTGIDRSLQRSTDLISCSGCAAGHAQQAPHRLATISLPPGHTLVADIAGPLSPTDEGFRYVLIVTELHTRFRIATFLKRRSEAEAAIMSAPTAFARHFGHSPARLRVDNANELLSKAMLIFLQQRGVASDPATAHTPQENSVAERVFRTLFGRVRATLAAAAMPFARYWGWCSLDTIIKYNSTWQRSIQDIPRAIWELCRKPMSPFSVHGLDMRRFRIFGEYAHVTQLHELKKEESRAVLVRYLFADGPSHYRVMRPETGQILRVGLYPGSTQTLRG